MCVVISLQLLSETFFILRRIEQDMIENVYWSLFRVCFHPFIGHAGPLGESRYSSTLF